MTIAVRREAPVVRAFHGLPPPGKVLVIRRPMPVVVHRHTESIQLAETLALQPVVEQHIAMANSDPSGPDSHDSLDAHDTAIR